MLRDNTWSWSPDVFFWKNDQNGKKIWNCATSLTPLKRVRLMSKPDCVMQLNCRWVHAYASCETTSNNRKLQSPRSIKNASPFRQTMAAYICSSSYFVVNLETESVYVSFSITWYTISDSKFYKNLIIYKSYSLLTYLGTNSYQ